MIMVPTTTTTAAKSRHARFHRKLASDECHNFDEPSCRIILEILRDQETPSWISSTNDSFAFCDYLQKNRDHFTISKNDIRRECDAIVCRDCKEATCDAIRSVSLNLIEDEYYAGTKNDDKLEMIRQENGDWKLTITKEDEWKQLRQIMPKQQQDIISPDEFRLLQEKILAKEDSFYKEQNNRDLELLLFEADDDLQTTNDDDKLSLLRNAEKHLEQRLDHLWEWTLFLKQQDCLEKYLTQLICAMFESYYLPLQEEESLSNHARYYREYLQRKREIVQSWSDWLHQMTDRYVIAKAMWNNEQETTLLLQSLRTWTSSVDCIKSWSDLKRALRERIRQVRGEEDTTDTSTTTLQQYQQEQIEWIANVFRQHSSCKSSCSLPWQLQRWLRSCHCGGKRRLRQIMIGCLYKQCQQYEKEFLAHEAEQELLQSLLENNNNNNIMVNNNKKQDENISEGNNKTKKKKRKKKTRKTTTDDKNKTAAIVVKTNHDTTTKDETPSLFETNVSTKACDIEKNKKANHQQDDPTTKATDDDDAPPAGDVSFLVSDSAIIVDDDHALSGKIAKKADDGDVGVVDPATKATDDDDAPPSPAGGVSSLVSDSAIIVNDSGIIVNEDPSGTNRPAKKADVGVVGAVAVAAEQAVSRLLFSQQQHQDHTTPTSSNNNHAEHQQQDHTTTSNNNNSSNHAEQQQVNGNRKTTNKKKKKKQTAVVICDECHNFDEPCCRIIQQIIITKQQDQETSLSPFWLWLNKQHDDALLFCKYIFHHDMIVSHDEIQQECDIIACHDCRQGTMEALSNQSTLFLESQDENYMAMEEGTNFCRLEKIADDWRLSFATNDNNNQQESLEPLRGVFRALFHNNDDALMEQQEEFRAAFLEKEEKWMELQEQQEEFNSISLLLDDDDDDNHNFTGPVKLHDAEKKLERQLDNLWEWNQHQHRYLTKLIDVLFESYYLPLQQHCRQSRMDDAIPQLFTSRCHRKYYRDYLHRKREILREWMSSLLLSDDYRISIAKELWNHGKEDSLSLIRSWTRIIMDRPTWTDLKQAQEDQCRRVEQILQLEEEQTGMTMQERQVHLIHQIMTRQQASNNNPMPLYLQRWIYPCHCGGKHRLTQIIIGCFYKKCRQYEKEFLAQQAERELLQSLENENNNNNKKKRKKKKKKLSKVVSEESSAKCPPLSEQEATNNVSNQNNTAKTTTEAVTTELFVATNDNRNGGATDSAARDDNDRQTMIADDVRVVDEKGIFYTAEEYLVGRFLKVFMEAENGKDNNNNNNNGKRPVAIL